jgi:hypothetical protein
MKHNLRLLACAAACGFSLSSCVVDPYGMPVAGGVYPAPTYASVNYYDTTPVLGGIGYAPHYAPVATSFGFFGGRTWGNGWGNNCNTPLLYSGGRSFHHSSRSYRPPSSSHHYASQVTRPSTFRGSPILSSPPRSPSISAPRTLSRPSVRSVPSPSPSRSFSIPSQPRPSGRAERPGVASSSRAPASRTVLNSSSSSSGRFGGMPSDMRRGR